VPDPAPLRLGVIGCGRIAQVVHLPAIAKSPAVELVAVSDPSPTLSAGVGARYGVPGLTDTGALLAADLDAVLIAVPDRLHLPLATRALAADRHVLLEKPSAATAAEGAQLAEAADKAGLTLQIGAMRRHDPALRWARDRVPELGELLVADLAYRLPTRLRASTEAALFPAMVVDESVRAGEAAYKADRPAYLLRTHGAHVFDTVRFFLGEVAEVRAQLARRGPDLHWQVSLATDRGLATVAITANTHSDYAEHVTLHGAGGELRVESYFPFYRRSSTVALFTEEDQLWRSPALGAVDPYQRQLEAFAQAVRTGSPAEPDGWDGLAALRLIEATAASVAAGGDPVRP
jgi:predicted dehydrogenase